MLDFLHFFSLTADQMFLEILNRSLAAVPVILAVLIARWLLKKLPRRLTVILWLIVFFRLLFPFTLESSAGLLPQEAVISPSAAAGVEVPLGSAIDAAQRTIGDTLNGGIEPVYVKTRTDTYNLYHSEVWLIVWGYLWPAGIAAMALYSLVSFLRLKKRLVGAMKLRNNIWLSDGIGTPFVTGVVRPKIYLPSNLSETDQAAILAHERAHIRHLDPALKFFAWLGLCLHWFNPLAWICFHLMVKDMETACDEAVTASLPPEERADYADTLLRLSTGKRSHAAAPLAFGEGDPQGRIRRIFVFKKPKTTLTILAAVLVVLLSFYLVTENSKEPHLLGGGYQATELLYKTPSAESIAVSDMPDFSISSNYYLLFRFNSPFYTAKPHLSIFDYAPTGMWQVCGQFQSYPLEKGELLAMFPSDEGWTSSWRPGRITDAWWLWRANDTDTVCLFLQTTAGESLLAFGERGQAGSGDTAIHYLFRLEPPTSVVYSFPDAYLALDVDFLMSLEGAHAEAFDEAYNKAKNWRLCGFTTDDGGIGFASYQWVDGYHKLIDIQFYPADELEYLQLRIPGCYIAPDPITSVPRDDLEREVFSSETYDAVFIFNEEVAEVKRIVTAEDGTVVSESSHHLGSVMGDPQLLYFSWAQEEGHNPCSVSYHFYDIDGNELS